MKKLFLQVLITILIMVTLVGCAQKTSQTEDESQNQAEVVTANSQTESNEQPVESQKVEPPERQENNSLNPKPSSDAKSDAKEDKYQNDPVPSGKPEPQEPQDLKPDSDNKHYCTLSITCNTVLDHLDKLGPDKAEIIPEDGVVFAKQTVEFYEGETVFNVLLRETKKNKIHMEFAKTPMFNSNYIEGIANLYEFDAGELSGWIYQVNNWFPNYGCSRYKLKDGDSVEWVYTCDLGRDFGAGDVNQKE